MEFSTKHALHQLWLHRGLLKYLVKLSMLAQYKKSFVGVFWLLLMPIFNVLVWVTLSVGGVFNPGETDIPYPAYVLLSTSIWQLFVVLFDQVSKSISAYSSVMVQAAFPRIIVTFEKVIVQLINFLIPLILNIVVLLALGVSLSWSALLFPLALIPLVLLGWGLGLIFSLVEIVAIDLYTLIHRVITTLLIFATPVVYTETIQSPILQQVMMYNPLTYLLVGARDILLQGELTNPEGFFGVSAGVFLFFLMAFFFFIRAERRIIEKIVI
jgi:lipopolysaccharide transport system permease protein